MLMRLEVLVSVPLRSIFAVVLSFAAAAVMIFIAVTPWAMAWMLTLPLPVLLGFSTLCLIVALVARRRARR